MTTETKPLPFDWRGFAFSIFILAVAGWAATGTPFRGDQALYTKYAERMNGGEVLYRDLWEVTNPGVFWFYQLAGICFGFNEDGVHLFEWLYWVAFVQLVSFATRRAHSLSRWPLAPSFLIGGVYYLTSCSDPSQLTKAEGLVAFPLFLSAWLANMAIERSRPHRGLLLAAGMAGGLAVLFKFAFAAIVLAGWLPVLVIATRRGMPFRLLPLVAGFLVPLAVAFAYLHAHGASDSAFRELFITPRTILQYAELAGFDRLANSIRWFCEVSSCVLAFALAGTFIHLGRRIDPMVLSIGLMVLAAVPVILVQRWSWWTYHFLLLTVPISVLAAYTWPALNQVSLERLGTPATRTTRVLIFSVISTLFLPVFGHGGYAYLRLVKHRFGVTARDRQAARISAGRAYSEAIQETDWFGNPNVRPGPIFVAGDPLFHTFSERPMANAIHGWSLELLTPTLWQRLLDELRATRPVYVYVDTNSYHYERLIDERFPQFRDWLRAEYREVRRTSNGVWYERLSPLGE
ncbi:MAG: hypothetical protein U0798_05905 [Gemmataceae bacterium]